VGNKIRRGIGRYCLGLKRCFVPSNGGMRVEKRQRERKESIHKILVEK
jgi:hypothetical protein